MLPLSHSLDLAWTPCSIPMGLRSVFLVKVSLRAMRFLPLSLVPPAGGYPEGMAKESVNPAPPHCKLYSLLSMTNWARVTFCGQVVGSALVQNKRLPFGAHRPLLLGIDHSVFE